MRDDGIFNLPLHHAARGGALDKQIDRAVRDIARQRRDRFRAEYASVQSKKTRARDLIDAMSDERVLQLGRLLGKRTVKTARQALYTAARYDLDRWLPVLEKENAHGR